MCVVEQAIQHGCGHRCISRERRVPLRERKIARDDDGAMFVSLRDRLEEMARFIA